MTTSALLIPTFRSSKQNIATLNYLSKFSSSDLNIIISDCSKNPKKHEELKIIEAQNPFVKIIYQTENVPLYYDIVNMFENTNSYDYVGIFPDDDYVSLSYIEKSIAILKKENDCVCSYGNYLIYQTNGAVFRDSRSALEETGPARLKTGFNPNYFNTMFFAVFQRSAMEPWINFTKNHPLISSFFDFLHCASLMAQGKIITHTDGQFLWTGENWDTPEANGLTRERYYIQVGLPASFALFHDLHFAVEGVNFFMGKHSPISDDETRIACAQIIWDRCIQRFKNDVFQNPVAFEQALQSSPTAIQALNSLLNQNNCDSKNILFWFTEILNVFSIEKSKRYFTHHIA
jgi:glycosyltransferase domain-containing protein